MIEPLENRLFCAATRYNLLTLIGYDNPGSSYHYRTTATVHDNKLIASGSHATTSKVGVSQSVGVEPPLYIAKTTTTDNTGGESLSLAQTGSGVNLFADAYHSNGVAIDFTFNNIQLTPTTMGFNKKYTGSGTVSGKVNVDTSSLSFSGRFTGTANTSVSLYGTTSITVRGHTYDNAIEGAYALNLDGTLSVSKDLFSTSGPVSLVQTETFYAVPGIGIVNDRRAITVTGQVSHSSTYTVPLTAKDDLISYVLGDNA